MRSRGWPLSTNLGSPGEEGDTHARHQDTASFPIHGAGNRAALLFPRPSLYGAQGQIYLSISGKPAVQLLETGVDFFSRAELLCAR